MKRLLISALFIALLLMPYTSLFSGDNLELDGRWAWGPVNCITVDDANGLAYVGIGGYLEVWDCSIQFLRDRGSTEFHNHKPGKPD